MTPVVTEKLVDGRPGLLLLACLPVSIGPTSALGSGLVYVSVATTTLALAALLSRQTPRVDRRRATGAVVAVSVLLGVLGSASHVPRDATLLHVALTVSTVVGGVVLLMGAVLRRHTLVAIGGALYALSLLAAVLDTPVVLDVLTFHGGAVKALLHGVDPYTITFPNHFSRRETALFYGPGIVVDGRITVGYPYPPAALLSVVPGYLLGDVRISLWACYVLAAGVLWWHSRATKGEAQVAAAVMVGLPGVSFLLVNGYTEPLSIVLLAAVVIGAERGWRGTPYMLGAFFVTKQYLLVMVPLLWLLLPAATAWRGGVNGFLVRASGTAAVLTVPFLLWSPRGLWDSVVAFQFRQPYRSDSFSLVTVVAERLGRQPTHLGFLTLGIGIGIALLLAWRAPRTPAGFAACLGVTMLTAFLLSTQAFANYYLMGCGALLIAVAVWPKPSETPESMRPSE